jgi:hypothetical protein
MKTQILIVAFLVPQIFTAIALYKLPDILKEPIQVELEPIKIEVTVPSKIRVGL